MGLRDLSLKEEYRSDRDDIVTEFFIPCLSNCIEYDRCIEYISVKSLTTLALGFDNFIRHQAKMRIVTGHRFGTRDLELISKVYDSTNRTFNGKFIRDYKIKLLKEVVDNNQIEMKISVPNSEEITGSFSEKIGIFRDEHDDAVAFTGTSNETFSSQSKSFESVDVFTSWNDKSRVETKMKDFEDLWTNKTKYVEVYDFKYAMNHNILKYSTEWATHT